MNSNNSTPHAPATPVVAPAKDPAVGQTQTQKTAPIDHAPKKDAPAVVPTPKI